MILLQDSKSNIKENNSNIKIWNNQTSLMKSSFLSGKDQKSITDLCLIPADLHCLLIQIVFSGFLDNVAKRNDINKIKAYENSENSEISQIHISSVLLKDKPEFLIYKEIMREEEGKCYLIWNTYISKEWLLILLISFLFATLSRKPEKTIWISRQ